MFAGMGSAAAGSSVDFHPAARRDMFEDRYGLQEAISALDRFEASPDRIIPQDGDGLRVSRLVVDIWVVSCEMQREGKSLTPPGNPEIGSIRSGLEMLTISEFREF